MGKNARLFLIYRTRGLALLHAPGFLGLLWFCLGLVVASCGGAKPCDCPHF